MIANASLVALALAVELGRGADAAEVAAAERDARDLEARWCRASGTSMALMIA